MGKANWTLVLVLGIAVIILGILVIPDLKALSPSTSNTANMTLPYDSFQTQCCSESIDYLQLGDKILFSVNAEQPLNVYLLSADEFETITHDMLLNNTVSDYLATMNFSCWQNMLSDSAEYVMNEPRANTSGDAYHFVFDNAPSLSENNITVFWTALHGYRIFWALAFWMLALGVFLMSVGIDKIKKT
jgi:hypothetical protein